MNATRFLVHARRFTKFNKAHGSKQFAEASKPQDVWILDNYDYNTKN